MSVGEAAEASRCRRSELSSFAWDYRSSRGQWRAMPHGIAGIRGNRGIVVSVSCRFYWALPGPNPTLSANLRL